VVPKIK